MVGDAMTDVANHQPDVVGPRMPSASPASGPAHHETLPIVEARINPVKPPASAIARSRIIARLSVPAGPPTTTVTAPAGYGKTTALGQWVAQEARPVAWLTVDTADNDAAVFVAYLAAALARVGAVDPALASGRATGRDRVLSFAVPRLLADLHRWDVPAVIVLDDVDRLTNQLSTDALVSFISHLPPGFHLVLAGRSMPELPIARLRAERRLLELGARDLALDEDEAGMLMASVGTPLPADELAALLDYTEGWAAGMYLATLSRARGEPARTWVRTVSGADRPIAAYLRSELVYHMSDADLNVVARCAVLDTLTPGAVVAVAGRADAWSHVETLAARNLFVHAVGRDGASYRYHRLLRDFLLTELERREPGGTVERHRAAYAWFREQGDLDAAVCHAREAGDRVAAARMVSAAAAAAFQGGAFATLERWLAEFEPADFEREPQLALIGCWVHMLTGHGDETLRLWDLAERSATGTRTPEPANVVETRRSLTRALMSPRGPRAMLEDATLAIDHLPPSDRWRTHALYLAGVAQLLLGKLDPAEELLHASSREAAADDGPNFGPLTALAAIRIRRQDWRGAAALSNMAMARLRSFGYEHLFPALAVHALEARIAAHDGDAPRARAALIRAQLARPLASRAFPSVSVASLLDLARASLALSDPGGAQILLREAEDIIRWTPSLGILTDELMEVRRYLSGAATALVGSSALTGAELRILPFLPTYLSFPEIGERLSISRNTVKTHALSIYGKLWASSRSEAVERAVELGLLEPYPGLEPLNPDPIRAES
jgi:LuxR family transcriptional regulator, maltose regulon positive regulatory protein